MTEQNKKNNTDLRLNVPHKSAPDEFDVAGKSLSEALRISFIILKIIMIVLVIAFLASGFKTVGSEEQALVLRFGKIRGVGEERLLGPGLHWILPYPIDEIVKIPVETKVSLLIDSFWYHESESERISGQSRIRPNDPLNPLIDGYCLTRSEHQVNPTLITGMQGDSISSRQVESNGGRSISPDSNGSDYNIVHSKWQLIYQVDNPEQFYVNVLIPDVRPGETYLNVIKKGVTPLLKSMFEDTVVSVMVNYTIDEAISSRDRIPRDVKTLLQDKLDEIESGIKVVSVQLTQSVYSPQVKAAFEASTLASQNSAKAITEARTYAYNTISKAAGPVADELFAALHDETVSDETREYLWSQVAGTAQEKMSDARVYATKVEKDAEANANYLLSLLPEYRQRPKLVIQKLYLDAIEKIIADADEKFFIQTSEAAKDKEIRVQLNKDPLLKSEKIRKQATEGNR
jgi:membrane protease subunit HflK